MTADRADPTTTGDDGAGSGALRAFVRSRLGIDPRALGAFRIGLGLIVLADLLLLRAPGLGTFYTDAGILPRSALAELSPMLATWSLHALSGSLWLQALLLAVTGVAAAALLVGYRHRLAALAVALLLASMHARNPFLVNGGDTILISLLVFAAALPLNGRWALRPRSLEAAHRDGGRAETPRVVSTATATVLLHLVVIYAINAVLKFRSDAWLTGVAVRRIFHLEDFVFLLGPTVAEYPPLLTAINWLWVVVLSASVLLVLAAGRLRTATVAAFVGAHLSMAATMRLGAFPFVMVTVLLLFLPPPVWDRIDRIVSTVGLAQRLESRAAAPSEPTASADRPLLLGSLGASRVRRGARVIVSVLLVVVLLVAVSWQVAAAGLVDAGESGSDGTLEGASWAFFAPDPPDSYSWYVVAANASGQSTDLVTGEAVSFDRPPNAMGRYPSTLWKRYGTKGQGAGDPVRESAGAYFCDRAPDDVESVTIYRVEQPVDANGPVGDPDRRELVTRACG